MLTYLLPLAESVPEAEDVVAGWTGFAVLMALIVATALLLWNFTKQIKKANAAKDAGVFGDEPGSDGTSDSAKE